MTTADPAQNGALPEKGVIRLKREPGTRYRIRSFEILLDGVRVGVIDPGTAREFVVGTGPHCVQLRVYPGGSPEVVVNVEPTRVLTVTCRPSPRAAAVILVHRWWDIDLAAGEQSFPPLGDGQIRVFVASVVITLLAAGIFMAGGFFSMPFGWVAAAASLVFLGGLLVMPWGPRQARRFSRELTRRHGPGNRSDPYRAMR